MATKYRIVEHTEKWIEEVERIDDSSIKNGVEFFKIKGNKYALKKDSLYLAQKQKRFLWLKWWKTIGFSDNITEASLIIILDRQKLKIEEKVVKEYDE